MRFSTRNLYYLRISSTAVLPLYLYLDEQHVDWMSERVLQHVLSDLRPLIPTKLVLEADAYLGPGGPSNAKRGTVDVHRGDTYQFGYFLRNMDPHAIVLKTRRFAAAPSLPKKEPAPREESATTAAEILPTDGRRKRAARPANSAAIASKQRTTMRKVKKKSRQDDSEEEDLESDDEDEDGLPSIPKESLATRRSTRRRTVLAGGYRETEEEEEDEASRTVEQDIMQVDDPAPIGEAQHIEQSLQFDDSNLIVIDEDEDEDVSHPLVKTEQMEPSLAANAEFEGTEGPVVEDNVIADETLGGDEDEDEKPKPVMSLKYSGFSIHGRCLCVIVEPYPPIRQQRAASLRPTGLTAPRAASIASTDFTPSDGAKRRARTPLFLPDPDERGRNVTPAPQRKLPSVTLWNEEPTGNGDEDGEKDDGMMAFSQVLQAVGGYTGAADDDELDDSVFLGDADEARTI